ncbi:MAG: undecaprenyl-diphosphate phosphatase [Candidatus Omnitrophota bacterium]
MYKYIFLGIVQGLTEFFPVSSSGHLVILQKLFGMSGNEVAVAVVLHLGTCLSLLVFFFRDILKLLRDIKSVIFIILVTLITGIIGVSGKHFFEGLFQSTKAVAIALLITGVVLLLTKKFQSGKREKINLKDAIILGITQGLAIAPGISRSGITIATLLFRKIERETCFRFSFLAAIPAIFGAALLEAEDVRLAINPGLIIGSIFSFASGLLALWLLQRLMQKARLHYFGVYCMIIAILTLLFVK